MLAGDGGMGKSTFAQQAGARVSRGESLTGENVGEPRGVVLLTVEEDAASVYVPRMRLMGADLDRVYDLGADDLVSMKLPSGAEFLAAECAANDIGLIIVDPGPSFMDSNLSSNREEDIRAVLEPLSRIAQQQNAIVLVLVHLNKGKDTDSSRRLMGGAAWRNAPRLVLLVGPPPGEDPRETRKRILAVEKSNLGLYPNAIGFELVPSPDDPTRATVRIGEEMPGVRPNDLVAFLDADQRTQTEEAMELLDVALSAGERPATEVQAELAELGIGAKAIRTACERRGVLTRREGFGAEGRYLWRLPMDAPGSPTDGDAA